jgi:hypothetical protein
VYSVRGARRLTTRCSGLAALAAELDIVRRLRNTFCFGNGVALRRSWRQQLLWQGHRSPRHAAARLGRARQASVLLWLFPASRATPHLGHAGCVAPSLNARTTGPRSSASGPRAAHRIVGRRRNFGCAFVPSSPLHSRAWAGPGGYRLPSPCGPISAPSTNASAHRGVPSAPSNSALQRTRCARR